MQDYDPYQSTSQDPLQNIYTAIEAIKYGNHHDTQRMLDLYDKAKRKFLRETKYINLVNVFLSIAKKNRALFDIAWQDYLQAKIDGIADNITFATCIKLCDEHREFTKVMQVAQDAEAAEKLKNTQNIGAKTHQRNDIFFNSLITAADRVRDDRTVDSVYTTALELGVANPCTVAAYIKNCTHRRNFSAAKEAFDQAIARCAIDSFVIVEYISICRATENLLEAKRAFEQADNFRCHHPFIFNAFMTTCILLKDYTEAEAAYRKAHSLKMTDPDTDKLLGSISLLRSDAQSMPTSSSQPYSMYGQHLAPLGSFASPMQGLSPVFSAHPYASQSPMPHSSPSVSMPLYEEEFSLEGDSKHMPTQSLLAETFLAQCASSVYGDLVSSPWQTEAHSTYFSQMESVSPPHVDLSAQYKFNNYEDALASMRKLNDKAEILFIYDYGCKHFPDQTIRFVNNLLLKSITIPELLPEAWRSYTEARDAGIADRQTYAFCLEACNTNKKPRLAAAVKEERTAFEQTFGVPPAYPRASHAPSPPRSSVSAGEERYSLFSPLSERDVAFSLHSTASTEQEDSCSLFSLPLPSPRMASCSPPTSTYGSLRESGIRPRSPEPADTDSTIEPHKRRRVVMHRSSLRPSPTASSDSSLNRSEQSNDSMFFRRTVSDTSVGAAPTQPRQRLVVKKKKPKEILHTSGHGLR